MDIAVPKPSKLLILTFTCIPPISVRLCIIRGSPGVVGSCKKAEKLRTRVSSVTADGDGRACWLYKRRRLLKRCAIRRLEIFSIFCLAHFGALARRTSHDFFVSFPEQARGSGRSNTSRVRSDDVSRGDLGRKFRRTTESTSWRTLLILRCTGGLSVVVSASVSWSQLSGTMTSSSMPYSMGFHCMSTVCTLRVDVPLAGAWERAVPSAAVTSGDSASGGIVSRATTRSALRLAARRSRDIEGLRSIASSLTG
jgi:hypothetical protein